MGVRNSPGQPRCRYFSRHFHFGQEGRVACPSNPNIVRMYRGLSRESRVIGTIRKDLLFIDNRYRLKSGTWHPKIGDFCYWLLPYSWTYSDYIRYWPCFFIFFVFIRAVIVPVKQINLSIPLVKVELRFISTF